MNVSREPIIHIVTCATDTARPELGQLRNSATLLGYGNTQVLCERRPNEKNRPFKMIEKLEAPIQFAEEAQHVLRPDDWVVMLDAYDAFLNLPASVLLERLQGTGADFVLGATTECFPTTIHGKKCTKLYPPDHQKQLRHKTRSDKPFVNAGFVAAKVTAWVGLREFSEKLKGEQDDQAFWHRMLTEENHNYSIFLDTLGKIVFNVKKKVDRNRNVAPMVGGSPSKSGIPLQVDGSVIPAVFHFPGAWGQKYYNDFYRRRFGPDVPY